MWLAGLIAVAMLLSACTGGSGGGDDDVIKIGVLLPLTGDLGFLGEPMSKAAELAVDLVNENGGILGKQVKAVVADSRTVNEGAREGAEYLINVEGVKAIVGDAGSGNSFAALAVAKPANVVMVSPASTSPDFTTFDDGGYFFRTAPSDSLQGAVMAGLAYNEGCREAGTVALNNEYGEGFKNVFIETFQRLGGSVVADILYNPEGTSFTSEVNQLAAANPKCVLLVAYPETGSTILREAYQQGTLDVSTWLLSEGMQSNELADLVGKDSSGKYIIEGIRGTQPKSVGVGYEAFAAAYEKKYGERSSGPFDAHTFDAALLIMYAIQRAGANDGAAIRDNIQAVAAGPGELVSDIGTALQMLRDGKDINWDGASGNVDLDDVGDVLSDYEVWQVGADGNVSILYDVAPPQ